MENGRPFVGMLEPPMGTGWNSKVFSEPGFSIAEEVVKAGGKGAIAAFSPRLSVLTAISKNCAIALKRNVYTTSVL